MEKMIDLEDATLEKLREVKSYVDNRIETIETLLSGIEPFDIERVKRGEPIVFVIGSKMSEKARYVCSMNNDESFSFVVETIRCDEPIEHIITTDKNGVAYGYFDESKICLLV
jgi:hypothetical protein